jgi:putative selenate reductase
MAAGAPDQSGRPRPLPTGETFALDCDLLVEAIGEAPDQAWLAGFGVACGTDGRPLVDPASLESRTPGVWVGGDARRGPASIIAAAADGRRAARSIAARLGLDFPAPGLPGAPGPAAGGDPAIPRPAPDRLAERGALRPSLSRLDPGYAANEVGRCLECDRACLRCVEVCPNRANIAIPVRPEDGFAQAWQIVHLDRFCNECGNCGRFCPSSGDPCRDKPALFASPAAMAASASPGLCFLPDPGAAVETGAPAAPTLRVRTTRGGPVTGMPAPAIGMEREPSCPEPAVPDRSGASRAALDSPGPDAPGGRASPELEPFVSLARVIRRDHPYLLAGGDS